MGLSLLLVTAPAAAETLPTPTTTPSPTPTVTPEPAPEVLVRLLASVGDAALVDDVRRVVETMSRVETLVVAGQRPKIPPRSLIDASDVVRRAIAACQPEHARAAAEPAPA